MHEALHVPPAQMGVAPEHCALVVQVVPPVGSQTPFTHAAPAAHGEVSEQPGKHAPSAQIWPVAH